MKEETNTQGSQINHYKPSIGIQPYHEDFDYEEFTTHQLIDGEIQENYPFEYNIETYGEFYFDDEHIEYEYFYLSYYNLEYEPELEEQEEDDYEKEFSMMKYISMQNPNLNTISELMKGYYENFEGLDEFWNEDTKSAEALQERMLFSDDYFNQMKKIEGENIQ